MARPKAIVFDAYGTLFDIHSVVEAGRAVTADPQALSTLWRQKQLEYTWLRTLMGRYEDFWAVTEAALRFALERLGIQATEEVRRLMNAYLSLATFPEVPSALHAMAGTPLGILSNGSPRMLEAAVRSSGLGSVFRHLLSVDAVRAYKPSPAAWSSAADRLLGGRPPGRAGPARAWPSGCWPPTVRGPSTWPSHARRTTTDPAGPTASSATSCSARPPPANEPAGWAAWTCRTA